jgi:hypothetical protein
VYVVGSTGISVDSRGAATPGGTLHALGTRQAPICGAPKVAYSWPALSWAAASPDVRCPQCVEQATATVHAAVPPQGVPDPAVPVEPGI